MPSVIAGGIFHLEAPQACLQSEQMKMPGDPPQAERKGFG